MTIAAAETVVLVLTLYAGLGALFGLYFVAFGGAQRIDPGATGMPLQARLLVFWGAAGLWPLMLAKVIAKEQPR
ncbi:MAG: hypothetical protein MI723_10060 [Caulobacterales bacterium]|nr:hypothetical protein [Caulobacterales bacterium]